MTQRAPPLPIAVTRISKARTMAMRMLMRESRAKPASSPLPWSVAVPLPSSDDDKEPLRSNVVDDDQGMTVTICSVQFVRVRVDGDVAAISVTEVKFVPFILLCLRWIRCSKSSVSHMAPSSQQRKWGKK